MLLLIVPENQGGDRIKNHLRGDRREKGAAGLAIIAFFPLEARNWSHLYMLSDLNFHKKISKSGGTASHYRIRESSCTHDPLTFFSPLSFCHLLYIPTLQQRFPFSHDLSSLSNFISVSLISSAFSHLTQKFSPIQISISLSQRPRSLPTLTILLTNQFNLINQ